MNKKPYRPYGGKRRGGIWLRALALLILLCAAGFAALEGVILVNAETHIRNAPRAMVILGCQVKPWGPSQLLQDRLDTALAYLEEHPGLPVVVSGGQGPDEPTTEARAMADYLIGAGYPAEQVHMEDKSHNTAENLQYSRKTLEELGLNVEEDEILLVSNGFHLARAELLAGRYGYGEISVLAAPSSHTPSRLKMYVREPLALVKSFLLDR